jgi:hypothetical protein
VVVYYTGKDGRLSGIEYSGENVRASSGEVGISGTHSAGILTMESLATSGVFDNISTFYFQGSKALEGIEYRGVKYVQALDASLAAKVTVLLYPNFLPLSEDEVRSMVSLQQVIFVSHMFRLWTPFKTLDALKKRGVALQQVYFNDWVESYVAANTEKRAFNTLQHYPSRHFNPVFWDLLPSHSNVHQERRDWIFHASFERGGSIAARVFCKMSDSFPPLTKFRILDYHLSKSITEHSCEGFETLGSSSKVNLYSLLSTTKYFLYLLVLPHNHKSLPALVHKDMFPTCVLEAVLMGVRVITLPVGPLPELFTSLVDFVPIHDEALAGRLKDFNFNTKEPYLTSDEFVDHVAGFMRTLDTQDFSQERMRRIELARTRFSEEKFKNLWLDTLDEPVSSMLK